MIGGPHGPLRASPGRPILLTSLASAALMDGRGDLELARETRGAVIDWGGVYGQLVRLTGPWHVYLTTGSDFTSLRDCQVGDEPAPTRWRSRHRWGRFDIVQDVLPVPSPPGAIRTLTVSVPDGPPASLLAVSSFTPFLLPVLVEGIRPVSFRVETSPTALHVRQRGFALSFRSNVPPSHLFLNRASWLGGRFDGRVDEVASDHELTVAPGRPTTISFLLSGGLERDTLGPSSADAVLADPDAVATALEEADRSWEARTPVVRFPDEPNLERAYGRARAALRRLYTEPGDGMTGLVAGYPWYSAIWCRDLAWMLPAVLWLGDSEWVARSLSTVFRFQSRSDVPLLGGEPGELPMQISPGPIFFYGTSDTTLYFPALVEQYLRHSADRTTAAGWLPGVERILGWGQARSDAVSGLLRNGGEAEAIAAATQRLARVRYGIDSPDTTIWDSADRRDHAVDVQVLWRGALLSAAELLGAGPNDAGRDILKERAERLAKSIRDLYAWPAESYLYDSRRNGQPVPRLRPNALRAVASGFLEPDRARAIVLRAGKDDLTTPWGVRTLSCTDPGYDPRSYHEGQVWTIATAWAAEAAFAVGEADLGLRYLRTISDRLEGEGGWANECYLGDRPEPFDSCFLLGFSIAPFLTTIFERLWGLAVDARVPRLDVFPVFPDGWKSASIERLRVGSGTASLDWSPERLRVSWSGPGSLEARSRAGRFSVAPNASAEGAGNVSVR